MIRFVGGKGILLLPLGEERGVVANEDEMRGAKNAKQRPKTIFHDEKAAPKREPIRAHL